VKRIWLVMAFAGASWGQTAPVSQLPDPSGAKQPSAKPAPPAQSSTKASEPAATQPGALASPAVPATPQATMAAAQAAMAASLAKQREAVVKQVTAVTGKAPASATSFFTVPWLEAVPQFVAPMMSESFNVPPCDPVPNDQLDSLILENAQQQNLQPDLIRAVIGEESGGRPCAVSQKGAQGLMQLMPSVSEQFGVTDPFDPKQNVEAGSKLLKQLLAKYNGDLRLTLSAYNAGSDRVDKDGSVPQIPETMNYVNDILSKLPKP